MSSTEVPRDLARRYTHTSAGRDWLASLPGRVEHWLREWDLEVEDGLGPWSGFGALVVPVRRGDERLVLKLAYPHAESASEPVALRLWAGRGAVRLVEEDRGDENDGGALLLERLDAGRRLQDVPFPEAIELWGAIVRQLSIQEDDRPEWAALDRLDSRAERWSDELPERWTRLERPFPRWLLEAALDVCSTRGVVGRRGGRDVLVHTDLHGMNILGVLNGSAPDGSVPDGSALDGSVRDGSVRDGSAPGFRAIDPQAAVGEAEFAVAPMLWNRLSELSGSDAPEALLERCHGLAQAACLDPEVARSWAVLREVENALWYAAKPGHEGDLERSLWVASALCSRPLPGLPPAPELKRLDVV